MKTEIEDWLDRARRFEAAAHNVLSTHEDARASRVVKLEQVYQTLGQLNIRQDGLMREALRCAQHGLYRAAHVLAWAACMDYIKEKLAGDGLAKVHAARPNWQGRDIGEMAEYVPEHQLVDVLKNVGLGTKNDVKALHGLLAKRNECAHPSSFLPGLNETLGYIEEIIQRVRLLAPKNL